MSAPTDPALLARLSSGEITSEEYRLIMAERTAARDDAQKVIQLQLHAAGSASTGSAAQLAQSEFALIAESARRRQEEAVRAALEQQWKAAEAAAVQLTYDQSAGRSSPSLQLLQDEIARADYERYQVEDFRHVVESAPLDWQSLPAEAQGFAIAEEAAARRAFLAETFGDVIDDARPAYQVQPVVDEEGRYTNPYYAEGYVPGQPKSPSDVTIPETDLFYPELIDYWGANLPADWPNGGGGCAGGVCGDVTHYGTDSEETFYGTDSEETLIEEGDEGDMDNDGFERFLAALDALQHGGSVSWGPGLTSPQLVQAQPAIPVWVWVVAALVVLWFVFK